MKTGNFYKEMRKFLTNKYRKLEDIRTKDFKYDCQIAIWHYCKDYYSSIRDERYCILKFIKYKNSTGKITKEDYNIQNYYNSLVKEFENKEGENH